MKQNDIKQLIVSVLKEEYQRKSFEHNKRANQAIVFFSLGIVLFSLLKHLHTF